MRKFKLILLLILLVTISALAYFTYKEQTIKKETHAGHPLTGNLLKELEIFTTCYQNISQCINLIPKNKTHIVKLIDDNRPLIRSYRQLANDPSFYLAKNNAIMETHETLTQFRIAHMLFLYQILLDLENHNNVKAVSQLNLIMKLDYQLIMNNTISPNTIYAMIAYEECLKTAEQLIIKAPYDGLLLLDNLKKLPVALFEQQRSQLDLSRYKQFITTIKSINIKVDLIQSYLKRTTLYS